jgi:hypothetical protein
MKPHRECPLCIVSVRLSEVEAANMSNEESLAASKLVLNASAEAFEEEPELTRIASRIFIKVSSTYPQVAEYYRVAKRRDIDAAKAQLPLLKIC